ncbi:CBS domain-containing protein [Streptomyces roseifaciens]
MKHCKTGTVMKDDVVRAEPDTPFKEVARLLAEHRISGLPVVDARGKVLGVISETDLLTRPAAGPGGPERRLRLPRLGRAARRSAAKARARTAEQLMTAPAVTVRAGDSIAEAARTMARHRVERLPVVDEENRLVGIVTRRELLQVFLRTDADIRREVVDEVLVRTLWLAPHAVDVAVADGVVTLAGELEQRSEVQVALRMTKEIDGVVAVVDKLTHRVDDSRLRPDEQALHGVADGWLRRL